MSAQDTETHVGAAGKTTLSPCMTSPRSEKHGTVSRIAGERRRKWGIAVWQDLPQRLKLLRRSEMLPKAAAGHTSAAFAQNLPLVDLGLVRSEPDFNGTGSNLIAKRHATKHEASCCGGAGAFSGMRAGRVHASACLG